MYVSEASKIRKDLHKIPESGFNEFKTQKYIFEYLEKLQLEPIKCAGTGVVCFIDMGKDETVALRCDMDGLSVEEKTNLDYKSTHQGMMHACGHDAHMSMLLALANKIKGNGLIFKYNVLLIFQPAEEGPGGAEPLIKEGVLDKYNVKYVIAMHLSPDYEFSKLAFRKGEFFAGGAELYFDIKGQASHGAKPEKAKSALLAGAKLIMLINELSLSINKDDGVLSLGSFISGNTMNVIPGEAQISGILRTYNINTRDNYINKLHNICSQISEDTGCDVGLNINLTYPPLVNDEILVGELFDIFGDKSIEAQKVMLTEDFAYYAKERASVMMFLGINDGKHIYPLHSPQFDFDEQILEIGTNYYLDILKNLK